VISAKEVVARRSPAVKTMWSTFPVFSKRASRSCSSVGFDNSQAKPLMEVLAAGYESWRDEMAALTRSGELEEIVMLAEDSMRASATPYPIPFPALSASCSWIEFGMSKGLPDVPPMIRTCLSASLLYFCCYAISDVRIDVSE
jgi:hypothetical protein